MFEEITTRKPITNPAKAGLEPLICLDTKNVKQYNDYNNESCNFHYLLLRGINYSLQGCEPCGEHPKKLYPNFKQYPKIYYKLHILTQSKGFL